MQLDQTDDTVYRSRGVIANIFHVQPRDISSPSMFDLDGETTL